MQINMFINSKCKDTSNSNNESNNFILHCAPSAVISIIEKKIVTKK